MLLLDVQCMYLQCLQVTVASGRMEQMEATGVWRGAQAVVPEGFVVGASGSPAHASSRILSVACVSTLRGEFRRNPGGVVSAGGRDRQDGCPTRTQGLQGPRHSQWERAARTCTCMLCTSTPSSPTASTKNSVS